MRVIFSLILLMTGCMVAAQGSYAPGVGINGSKAIYKDSSLIKSWASSVTIDRGYIDLANKSLGKVNYGKADYAIGKSDPRVVSLGDSGIATVSFKGVLHNGPGPDFCVFENSFNDNFLELAFVEVSSDGVNYYRFPAFSETDTISQVGPFGFLDASNLYNLAGKYRGQHGTPFDLQELKNTPNLDLDSVRFIRIVDVIGSIDSSITTYDSKGRRINDPYPTNLHTNNLYSGGFDLDAVGLINYLGEIFLSNPFNEGTSLSFTIYPNPASSVISISNLNLNNTVKFYNLSGEEFEAVRIGDSQWDISLLERGLYFIEVNELGVTQRGRFVKL